MEGPRWPSDPGCLATAWFGLITAVGAGALTFPVIGLSALVCSSGGPDCGGALALWLVVPGVAAIEAARRRSPRWSRKSPGDP